MYRFTSTLPALQCTGVVTMSDRSPLNAGRTSSRSQQVFHRAVLSHGDIRLLRSLLRIGTGTVASLLNVVLVSDVWNWIHISVHV